MLAENATQTPMACWFEACETRDGEDYTLHTSPINVSEAMQALFWNKVEQSVVLCSATLRSMGKFDDFLRKLGLKNNTRVRCEQLSSPFFYQHSVLFVPMMRYEPSQINQTEHLQEMVELLPQFILPHSGTLVLFTSRQAMWCVFKQLDLALQNDILLQDDYSKIALIQRHKKQIDSGARSIIFGLASFAEGIDLPGKYCEHVIIQKIPFLVPSDPIAKTRSEWLKKHRKDAFQLVTLPETSTKLAQYVGRLLRHEEDRGIVTILDKRLYSKQYGQSLLENMPAFTRLLRYSAQEFLQHDFVRCFYSLPRDE
jgi:ATP-dependent DNA helicase DinG